MRTPGNRRADTALSQKVPNKSQAASLAAQRPGADPQKTRFRRLERVGPEVADQHFALFAAILVDRLDQIPPQMSGVAKSETFRGRSLAAKANSVRAISQWEKWLRCE